MSSTNLIEETRKRFTDRRDELRPMVEEFNEIEGILALMSGKTKRAEDTEDTGRKRTPRKASNGSRRNSGERTQEFLTIVGENPGIKTSEVARRMGMDKPNYAYRIKKSLVEQGKLSEDDEGLVLVGATSEVPSDGDASDDDDGFHDPATGDE